ncbi:hypothetical protein P43SY_010064 [Pythium insidiosum]|uniref:Uncharacterized protein n=1 Tax=Pythium insidiosum TaxID=114742 RepID=A0AAD5M3X1_PYTIN|nr:hypothetical protein P43SY_010064 [Pythium insidiosum]
MADPTMLERLRRGRARLHKQDAPGAIVEWKEALALAYSSQRYSIAFVLSKNLGDAHVEIAKTAPSPARSLEKLREARDYYTYALGLHSEPEATPVEDQEPEESSAHCYEDRDEESSLHARDDGNRDYSLVVEEALDTIHADTESPTDESSALAEVADDESYRNDSDPTIEVFDVVQDEANPDTTLEPTDCTASAATDSPSRLVYDIAFLRSLQHCGQTDSPDIARVASLCSSLVATPVSPRKPTGKAKKKGKARAPPTRAHSTKRMMGDMNPNESAQRLLSYNMLQEVLQVANIDDDEEAVMITRMKVDPRHTKEFERLLRLILKNTHTAGHVSTCVVKPPPGDFTYTSIVKYSSLMAMRQIFPSSVESGAEFYKLIATRDSMLLEPPTYQIEGGFGTWIESDGNTRPMRDDSDDPSLVYQNVPGPCCDDSCDNPHGLNVRASFVAPSKGFQLFQSRYQRNNKKGGQKNLRCFPCCRNGRHVSSGFCGDSIRVHVAVSRITTSGGVKICPLVASQPAVLAFARFINLDGTFDATVSGPEVVPGQTVEKHDILQWVRDKDHPLNPLFPGILRSAAMESSLQSAIFEFNAECKAWHYGWTAPRGQGLSGSDARHVLEILFVKPVGSYLYILERLRSDTFSIYSSRRAGNTTSVRADADAYEQDDDMDDSRGSKRKRTQAPPSPATSTSTSSSVTTPRRSPTASPAHWPSASPSQMSSVIASLELNSPHSDRIKVEDASSPHQHLHAYSSGNLGVYIQSHASPEPPLPTTQNSWSFDLGLNDDSTDLMNHTLFTDAQERRVVAREELPWSELYNLFDSMPTITHGSSSSNDEDMASPPTSETVTNPVTAAAADAILTFL